MPSAWTGTLNQADHLRREHRDGRDSGIGGTGLLCVERRLPGTADADGDDRGTTAPGGLGVTHRCTAESVDGATMTIFVATESAPPATDTPPQGARSYWRWGFIPVARFSWEFCAGLRDAAARLAGTLQPACPGTAVACPVPARAVGQARRVFSASTAAEDLRPGAGYAVALRRYLSTMPQRPPHPPRRTDGAQPKLTAACGVRCRPHRGSSGEGFHQGRCSG
jgi:hypothetical protein